MAPAGHKYGFLGKVKKSDFRFFFTYFLVTRRVHKVYTRKNAKKLYSFFYNSEKVLL